MRQTFPWKNKFDFNFLISKLKKQKERKVKCDLLRFNGQIDMITVCFENGSATAFRFVIPTHHKLHVCPFMYVCASPPIQDIIQKYSL